MSFLTDLPAWFPVPWLTAAAAGVPASGVRVTD
jgi:hypothetical protein